MDIGGHRFFSKSDWVMNWWRGILPIAASGETVEIAYQGQCREVMRSGIPADGANGTAPIRDGLVMLVRDRLSRIYFLRKYFDYPIKLNATTLTNLGPARLLKIGVSYVWAVLFPRRPERSLEDFLFNRFGGELYRTFFKDYTEKVWGVPCDRISADWGAQRIKGLSVVEALRHALRQRFGGARQATKTSLIEHFLYPRLGPGQMWQEVARRVIEGGGEIRHGQTVQGLRHEGGRVTAVVTTDGAGALIELSADHVISTMPVKDLVAGLKPPAPADVQAIAASLPYRDFITVGLLVSRMRANSAVPQQPCQQHAARQLDLHSGTRRARRAPAGIQQLEPGPGCGPGPSLARLEYFCQKGDDLWQRADQAMIEFAAGELEKIGMIDRADVLDGTVIRVPKTYPAYFGAYEQFPLVQAWLDQLANLYLVGRNGMHRYNNQDHSMITAKLAVDAILNGTSDKAAIWAVNIDDDYHEETDSKA
jgi:protoporphyrinogen oxidase